METIKLQKSLYRDYFYYKIVPHVYSSLINNEQEFLFDLSESEFSNAEFLVELLCTASLIVNKKQITGQKARIPLFVTPTHYSLLNYLQKVEFFGVANSPNNQVFRFNEIPQSTSFYKKYVYHPQLFCISLHSDIKTHQDNISKIVNNIFETLDAKSIKDDYWFRKKIEISFIQLVINFFEHNLYDNTYLCSCYYIAQKMPNETLQIVFYDTGKGFRKRIIEMINKEKKLVSEGVTPKPELSKYMEIEDILTDKSCLRKKTVENSNLCAIRAALDYRSDSLIPGLNLIKEFTLLKGGTFFVHSGNASLEIDKEGNEQFEIFDENFSGVHFCFEIPLI